MEGTTEHSRDLLLPCMDALDKNIASQNAVLKQPKNVSIVLVIKRICAILLWCSGEEEGLGVGGGVPDIDTRTTPCRLPSRSGNRVHYNSP